MVDEPDLNAALLEWYAAQGRDLPWRRTHDPYAILVSEIMLQQTRAQTVIPYYEKFLERFPTARDLAEAAETEVLRRWSGLGYYRRARSLHGIARETVARYAGRLPDDGAALQRLSGIGRYTAGAILAFAHSKDAALVDTNVRRVLGRVFLGPRRLKRLRGEKVMWDLAESLIPAGRAYDYNQALMDFGATRCTARKPRCPRCPMKAFCRSYDHGQA